MSAIVQFSTGLGSGEVARRMIEKHGPENVVLLTADTRVEDADNWRYAHEFVNRLGRGVQWHILADGRTPMQAGRDHRAVPSDRMAICSRVLKRELLRRWIDTNADPATDMIALGYDWTEPARLAAALPHWAPFEVVCPMMDEPLIDKFALHAYWTDVIGIKPPRLYDLGFPHANCGGACVRSGQAAWAMTLDKLPEVYAEWEAEEHATQVLLGKKVTILTDRTKAALADNDGKRKPLSLTEFRERIEAGGTHDGDMGHCGCDPFQETFDFEAAAVRGDT